MSNVSTTPNIDRLVVTPQHGKGLHYGTVEVVAVGRPTPAVARVTFGGPGLDWFSLPCSNVAVRLFFPLPGETLEVHEPQEDLPAAGFALRSRARVYTARRFDVARRELVVDFVLHGSGLAAAWAADAAVGDRLLFGGPRAHAEPVAGASHHVFAADESALPALATVMAALDSEARGVAFVSAAGEAETQPLDCPPGIEVRWVDRSAGTRLAAAVADWLATDPRLGGSPAAWLAGELFETRAVRAELLDDGRHSATRLRSFPYWRRGSDATTFDEARAGAAIAAVEAGRDPAELDDLELVDGLTPPAVG